MIIDPNTLQSLLTGLLWIVPVVIALVAVIRGTFGVADRYVPAVSLIVGIAAGLLFVGLSPIGAAAGMVVGLAASGSYDIGKKTVLDA